jgi:hypothetical protein
MPKFSLVKHADSASDAEICSTFHVDHIDLARAHFDDFLQASGFSLPELKDDPMAPPQSDKWEDLLWDDAFASKFRNDGPVGGNGADVIKFPVSDS